LRRGEIGSPGGEVDPGTLNCIEDAALAFELDGAGNAAAAGGVGDEGNRRAALARWLSDPANALAWRSIVNRVWHYHFGRGIVDTPNDFGLMGGAPSHPHLLDWLAIRLLEGGGSLKELHRRIVTSAVYRQAKRYDSPFAKIDADNRFLWRMNRRRLEAESIRDAALQIAGKLVSRIGGPSARPFVQSKGVHVTPVVDYNSFDVDHPDNYRRSIYRFIFRTVPEPFMEALDCPDSSQLAAKRGESLTALQALGLLNDRLLVRLHEHVAARIERRHSDPGARVEAAYRLILGRWATASEVRALVEFARRHGLANACRVLFNSNEFVFVD